MRKALTAIALATALVGLLAAPAIAAKPDTNGVIPLDYTIEGAWNPCTEASTDQHLIGELQIFALPSIDSFFDDTFEHATLKWVGQVEGDDGYSMPWRHFATSAINIKDGKNPHVVISETDNLMFTGADGGKFRVKLRFHVTDVGGDLKAFTDVFDATCIRHP